MIQIYKISFIFQMLKIFSKRFFFSSIAKSYQKYLNEHIKKSLQNVSTPNKIKSKQVCESYFQRLSQITIKQQQKMKNQVNMIFSASFQLQNFDEQRNAICQMILNNKIKSQSELDRILKFIFKEIKFNSRIAHEQIQNFIQDSQKKTGMFRKDVQKETNANKNDFNQKNSNALCKKYRQKYPQVDSKLIYERINCIVKDIKNRDATIQGTMKGAKSSSQGQRQQKVVKQQNKFWDKIHNIKPRLIKEQMNSTQIYQQHKKITNNRLRFRFPPQPNGYLHIGHLKSIRMNFQTARRLGGECYLRYDDTNPQKETVQFIQEIQENVKWMGYTPDGIKFTSDYFQQMLHFADKLVRQGKAYVCESSQDEIQAQRKQKRPNPYRLRQKQFSLNIFPNLSPNQTLRLKLNPSSPNPTLRDPIIYRYKSTPHPKTGTRFNVYPMYDFAHCISDSIQHIDYSLCSLEFEIRRQLYYQILDMLNLYKPIVWQFSRLNVKGNVISKRKIKRLIDQNKIQGWDDPRLLTIRGMQRRGYTPVMLNYFIDKVNSSRSGNQKFVRFQVLQKQMKKQLVKDSKKITALRKPIKVNLIRTDKDNAQNRYKLSPARIDEQKFIHIQEQQMAKIEQHDQIIVKNAGVFNVVKTKGQIKFQKSYKTVQQAKNNDQKIPILSWLPQNLKQITVTFYQSLLDDNQQFNASSKKDKALYIDSEDSELFAGNQKQVYLFERIGYFKKDQKTGHILCCAKL